MSVHFFGWYLSIEFEIKVYFNSQELSKKRRKNDRHIILSSQSDIMLLSAFTINPFPYKPWFLHVCSTSLLKTQWEKEKLLVTSNFSFSHSVFYPFGELSTSFVKCEIVVCKVFQFGRVYNLSLGKELRVDYECHRSCSSILSYGALP